MTVKLLPCPFCGKTDDLEVVNTDGLWAVACGRCTSAGPLNYAVENARPSWNCRWPVYPEPNWATAPDWAEWWAVEPRGESYWYPARPEVDGNVWWGQGFVGAENCGPIVDLPLGCDWRLTLRRRPEVTE